MKFISSRELRRKSGELREKVREEDYVLTSNGKPVAIITAADEDLEQQLRVIRRAKAEMAVYNMRKRSLQKGLNKLSEKDIEAEIEDTRRNSVR